MKNITVITISLLIAAPLSGRAAEQNQIGPTIAPSVTAPVARETRKWAKC